MIWLDAVTENLPGPMHLRVRGRSMLPTLRPGDEVVVNPVTAEALAPGDWVVVHSVQGAFLHRYLGWRHGRIITKGDGHRALDPSWPPDAVLGRVVGAQRGGHCFYCRTPGQLRRERLLAAGHQTLGDVWGVLRRIKALLLALFVVAVTATFVWAAVGLTDFYAEAGADTVTVYWETASETDNLGFRLWRSLDELDDNAYADISGFIASLDEGAGAFYEYEDTEVTPGVPYYYKLEDLPSNGLTGEMHGPISATVPFTTTPTLTPTATSTPTPTSTPLPTSTPNPNVQFWADKTDLTAGECATLYWQTNNILAIFFDNVGVYGDGERAFCPCETESHTLRVKYLDSTTEDFVITLNVTGQCGVTPTSTSTLSPKEPVSDGATATPRPTFTPSPTLLTENPTVTASAEADIATATASTEAQPAILTATATTQVVTQDDVPDTPQASGTPISSLATLESPSDSGAAPSERLSARGPVEGESTDVPVEKMLSIWLLIVGGIVGAGFIGAGILMWKRQQ
ncbi:MAG: hypothetical protein JXR84_11415 [Anaerolineae bacterium]|nr:hypothetical protein [Anaerolineae bacterium]